MIEIELTPGIKLLVDPDKFTVQGGMSFGFSPQWSNEIVISVDLNFRDILEGSESKLTGAAELRSKP